MSVHMASTTRLNASGDSVPPVRMLLSQGIPGISIPSKTMVQDVVESGSIKAYCNRAGIRKTSIARARVANVTLSNALAISKERMCAA